MTNQSAAERRKADTSIKFVTPDILLERQNDIQAMIAHRAYELFESRGQRQGCDLDDWIEAEAEILRPYRHNLEESSEAVIYRAELPGAFTADQLNVSIEPRRLSVSGERELTCGGSEPAHIEKRTQRIFRVEELPVDIDPSRTTAKLKSEVLEIVMPKIAAAGKPRKKAA
jgi:HSP20 family molecular chaperone IbpA